MPHLILEYSNNIVEQLDFKSIFQKLHSLIVKETDIPLANIKSRAIGYEHFFVSDGADSNAFVHLTVIILGGKSPDVKKRLGETALAFLEKTFILSHALLTCSLTVEVREVAQSCYFKAAKKKT